MSPDDERLVLSVCEAIAINEPVVADSERLLGAEHPYTLMARTNLDGMKRGQG